MHVKSNHPSLGVMILSIWGLCSIRPGLPEERGSEGVMTGLCRRGTELETALWKRQRFALCWKKVNILYHHQYTIELCSLHHHQDLGYPEPIVPNSQLTAWPASDRKSSEPLSSFSILRQYNENLPVRKLDKSLIVKK